MNKARRKGNKRGIAGFAAVSRDNEIGDGTRIKRAQIAGKTGSGKGTDKGSGEDKTDTRQDAGSNSQGRIRTKSTNESTKDGTEKRTDKSTERGRFELMQYIHGFIAVLLVLLAVIHIPFPEPFAWLPYSIAAALAVLTLKSEISIPVSRVLAIATTGMMFFFFALFFLVVPTLKAGWYTTQYGWAAVCLLLSAFVMIPILSDYSCRLKADCREARAARKTAFFSVPSHINPESR